jgi:anti-anti-sigma factor
MTAAFSPAPVPALVLPPLRIDVSRPSPVDVGIAVVGEVDMATAHVLHDVLLHVLDEHAPAVLTIDLAGVTFLDCTGISTMVAARNAAIQAGRQVRVTHPQDIVRRVLDLAGLLDALTAPIDRPKPPGSDHPPRIDPPARTPPCHLIAA